MIEIGIISSVEIGTDTCKARVKMTTRDDAVSPPLFILQLGTLENKSLWLPKVNEQVAFMLTERGKSGFILGAIYSKRDTTHADLQAEGLTGTVFSDGSRVFFDESTSILTVDARSSVVVTADTAISAKVGTVEVSLSTSKVKVANAITDLKTLFDQLCDALGAPHVHPTAMGPSGPPVNTASFAAVKALADQLLE